MPLRTPVAFRVTGTGAFVAVKATQYSFTGELTADSANGSSIELRVDASADSILMPASAVVYFEGVDLNRLQIKGDGLVLIVQGTK